MCVVSSAGRKTVAGCILCNVVNLNFSHSVEGGHTASMGCEYLYTVMVGKCEGRKPFCMHWSGETGNAEACWKKCGFESGLDGASVWGLVEELL